jgi:hypothetical protein
MRMRYRIGSGRRSVWFWVFVAVVLILLLGLLFGGYRKGVRIGSGPTGVHSGVTAEAVWLRTGGP